MSDLGAIVKTGAEDMAEAGEKAGTAIMKHFEGIGTELENSATRYRSVESDIERSFTSIASDGTKTAERATSSLGKDAARSVDTTARNVGAQGESEARNLAAESEQEAQFTAREQGSGGASDDPIDLVTGEMYLPQVDLRLEGIVPLVLERRHGSMYRRGRWFGTRWASTLDQRIEVDDDGIHYAAPDGRVLHYPIPAIHGQKVMPSHGPRWPLTWSRPEDLIEIEQGDLGRTLQFRPGPTPQVCRPLTAIVDRGGNRITFICDDDGVPTDVYHSGGYHVVIESTETRGGVRVSALKLANPRDGANVTIREFRYDMAGRLVGVVNSSRLAMVFDYDDADRITQWTDRNSYSYRYHYRADGRVERAEGDGGYLNVAFHYDPDARTTTMTDARGNTSVYHHNDQLQTYKVVDPLGDETLTEHDRHGEVTAITDPLGSTTRIERNAVGDELRVHRPDGTTVATTYNEYRQPVMVTGPDGSSWEYEYDETGAVFSITGPDGARAEYARDPASRSIESRDPLGRTMRVVHDKAGLPIELTEPDGSTTRLRRDAFGRVAEITDPLGGRTELTWSIEGKLLARTLSNGARETWQYDGEGNLLEYTSPTDAVTTFEYGPFDSVTARTQPDGSRYEFAYDHAMNLVSVTGPTGCAWTYEYDACGNLVREVDFNGAAQTYMHDAAARVIERVNAVGQATRTTYDAMGRIVSRHTGDVTSRYWYDPSGQLVRAERPGAVVEITRDASGRVASEAINGRSVTSVYDLAGQRVERTTPSGVVSRWTYDVSGRPASLNGSMGALSFDYDQAGREVSRHLGPGALLTRTYDEFGRLAGQGVWRFEQLADNSLPASQNQWRPLQARTYAYQADGAINRIEDQLRGPRDMTLDPAGRVTAVQGMTWNETYTYDPLGNLAHAAVPAGDPDSDGERRHAGTLVKRAGRTRYEHDGAGRLVRRTRATLSGRRKEWTYAWDAEDRLIEVATPDGRRFTYIYDPLGRRIAKHEHAQDGTEVSAVYFTWDGPHLIEEFRTNRTISSATTWDFEPDTYTPAAQTRRTWVDGATAEQVDEEFHAIVTDLVGTPTELVTPDGRIVWYAQKSLWGQTASVAGSSADCLLRFPGQYHDEETGLDYSYFRYYSPEDAAFLTPDPLGLAPAPNPHAYVPNPLSASDPLGLGPCPKSAWKDKADFSSQKTLSKKYDAHAGDFGVTGNRNNTTLKAYVKAMQDHMTAPDTKIFRFNYRSQGTAVGFINPNSGLMVMLHTDGTFWSGWRLGDNQLTDIIDNGHLW